MIWFNGKELIKQISQKLTKFPSQISNYFEWLIQNHSKEMWLKFDDLRKLRGKLG